MTTYERLKSALQEISSLASVPYFYASSKQRSAPPYIVYLGTGQNVADADNTHYWRENTYQVEYYYKLKNEAIETAIEDALLSSGFLYSKSEDLFIEGEDVFVIYYYI